jgi:hypothetical protein
VIPYHTMSAAHLPQRAAPRKRAHGGGAALDVCGAGGGRGAGGGGGEPCVVLGEARVDDVCVVGVWG